MKSSLPLALLALLLLPVSPSLGQVTVQSRFSVNNASDLFFDGSGPSDFQEFFTLGNFNTTGTASTESGIDVVTTQNSTVTESLFEIETFSDAGLSSTDSFTESIILLSVDFDVASPVTYLLEGTFSVLEGEDGFDSISVTLEDQDAPFNESIFSIRGPDNSQDVFSESGVLLPGSYFFDFNSSISSFAPDRGPITSSDLSLIFATIPEPSALTLCWGLLAVIATRRNRA